MMFEMAVNGSILILVLCICTLLIRAVKGPRFTDRIVGINMIGTLTTITILLLTNALGQAYLADIAMVYALLSFIALVVLCHVITLHHRGRMLYLERKEKEETQK